MKSSDIIPEMPTDLWLRVFRSVAAAFVFPLCVRGLAPRSPPCCRIKLRVYESGVHESCATALIRDNFNSFKNFFWCACLGLHFSLRLGGGNGSAQLSCCRECQEVLADRGRVLLLRVSAKNGLTLISKTLRFSICKTFTPPRLGQIPHTLGKDDTYLIVKRPSQKKWPQKNC